MGRVHPDQSIIRDLKGAEKSIVQLLADGLSNSWFIFTRQDMWTKDRPYEIDVLVMHEKYGFLAMEVKGGPVRIEEGEWYRHDHHFSKSPIRQVQDASYQLRDYLRENSNLFRHTEIPHAVVLPDVRSVQGHLPPSIKEEMLFLNPGFENIESLVINCIHESGRKQPLSVQQIQEFYRLVLPTVDFKWDPEAQRKYSLDSMTRISDEQIRALRTMEINDRVLVSGVAGSGKTRLALYWANQSARAGKNTLLSCYNDPLAQYLRSVSSDIETLTVGPFLRTVSQLPGIPPLVEPEGLAERDSFWNVVMIKHLLRYAHQSEVKFKTIVLDEFQDFNDEWRDIVEMLLEDEYSKLLCVADPAQDLYGRGFVMPEGGSPWALAELQINCRSTREIASFVRRFGGGRSASASPEGDPVKFVTINSIKEMLDAVLAEIRILVEIKGQNINDIVVITGNAAEREQFYNIKTPEFTFCRWEERGESSLACETTKRSKGIEANSVILATMNSELKKNDIYVGASRARTNLTVIIPQPLFQLINI